MKLDLQGPLNIRVANDDGVLLARFISAQETLYIDCDPPVEEPRVVTLSMHDTVEVTEK